MKGVADAHAYLGCIDGTLEVGVYVAALVSFGKQVVEVEHGEGVVFPAKIGIGEVVTADVVDLAVCYE